MRQVRVDPDKMEENFSQTENMSRMIMYGELFLQL
ncbi:hypothetical protein ACUXG3_003965 [Bacillus thuringiensis]